jgi:hypothetical protein
MTTTLWQLPRVRFGAGHGGVLIAGVAAHWSR